MWRLIDPTLVDKGNFLSLHYTVSHYITLLLHPVTQKKLILHDLMQIQMENLDHTNGLNTLENHMEYNSKGFLVIQKCYYLSAKKCRLFC